MGSAGLATAQTAPETPPATQVGPYQVQQTYSLGYRFGSIAGSAANYATFVNLQSGPRLLDGSLIARAAAGRGGWFDNLSLTTAGLGGDPQSVVRLHADQGKLYNFSGAWRRDENVFDYNLLSNPLNPASNTPAVGVGYTLHQLDLSHRMQDYELRLLPLARISFRLGYARNVQTGPAASTLHDNVDTQLEESYRTTMNSLRFGVDYKPFARTVLSYDQFFEYFKNDTVVAGVPTPYQLPNGTPVDLGFVFSGTTPCSNALNQATSPPTANPLCKGYLSYSQVAPARTSLPTERLSLHSDYWSQLALTASFSYNSGANTVANFSQTGNGLSSLTRATALTAATRASRVDAQGDGTAIWSLRSDLRLTDTFNLYRFENPGDYIYRSVTNFTQAPLTNGAASLLVPPAVFNSTNCPAPYTAATCPQHAAASVADLETGATYTFLGNNNLADTLMLDYDFSGWMGAHVGYRYSHQRVADGEADYITGDTYDPGSGAALAFRGSCALVKGMLPSACSLNPDGSVSFNPNLAALPPLVSQTANIHGNSLLFGAWARPSAKLRLGTDLAYSTADHSFDRIDPRTSQRYAAQAAYSPAAWATLSVDVDAYNAQDNAIDVHDFAHNRSYALAATLLPADKISFESGFTYNSIFSSALVCFTVGSAPSPSNSFACPVAGSPVKLAAIGSYSDLDHFVYADTVIRLVPRTTLRLGFAGSFTRGSSLLLDPLAPAGALQYDYLRPTAGVEFQMAPGTVFSGSWRNYDYGEPGGLPSGLAPFPLDNFHANLLTLSLRYSF